MKSEGNLVTRQRECLFMASILGFLGVAFGAFGAHALKDVLSVAGHAQYELGVRYAFIHALAIAFAALALPIVAKPKHLSLAAWLFVAGVVMFSGSLILMALTRITAFAVITPLGGLSLLLGWGVSAYAIRSK